MNVLEADLDALKDEFQQRDFESVRDKVEGLRQEMEVVKRDIQKRTKENRIESLVTRIEGIKEDIEILFTRMEKRAKQQRADELEEYLEKELEFNRNVLEGIARAASARAGDHENQFVALSTLIQYLVALERYYKIQGVNIWQYHPSNSEEGEKTRSAMMKVKKMSDAQQESTGDLSTGATQDCDDGLFVGDEFEELETVRESDFDWETESSSGSSGDRSNSTAGSSDRLASEDLSGTVPDVSEETVDQIRGTKTR